MTDLLSKARAGRTQALIGRTAQGECTFISRHRREYRGMASRQNMSFSFISRRSPGLQASWVH